ncbi:hypothetical protein FGO68_gene6596 [Halteria grandinella]|uniref:Uncharacterized protein n=1 Tax=Halteria grandinella TaxID=5974 RepID=A0A8J8T4L4_HALGN|nr:hypothetical protein FGO68_gene6596 [Halteria grandinella]
MNWKLIYFEMEKLPQDQDDDLMSQMAQCPMMSMQQDAPRAEERKQQLLQQYGMMLSQGFHAKPKKPVDYTNSDLLEQYEGNTNLDDSIASATNGVVQQDYFGGASTASSNNGEGTSYMQANVSKPKPQALAQQPSAIMGCPFFKKEITDPQGKNLTQGYPLKYLSRVEFLFNPDSTKKHRKKEQLVNDKKTFLNSLPWILKQTAFLDNDMLTRLRTIGDIGSLIFITDDTKIKGNSSYDQGDYYEALNIYEQVLACFAWLQFKEPNMRERLFTDPELDLGRVGLEGIVDDDIDFMERRVINEHDREIETETKLNFVVSTLNNSMLAYMSIFHFDEAKKCADFLLDTYTQEPEIYFRKAQIIYLDKTSTLDDLSQALDLLDNKCLSEFAIRPKSQLLMEKKQAKYRDLQAKLEAEIDIRINDQLQLAEVLLKRAAKMLENLRLKSKAATISHKTLEDNEMYQVMLVMNSKYPELIQFFRDNTTNPDANRASIQKTINEHQYFAKVFQEIKYILSFNPVMDQRVIAKLGIEYRRVLENPRLYEIMDMAKAEVADSIFFHASELNQVVYNHSWQLFNEERKGKREKEEEKKEHIGTKVYKKASGIVGALGAMADERVMYPANTAIFAFLVILMIYVLGSQVDRIGRFVSPIFGGPSPDLGSHYKHFN